MQSLREVRFRAPSVPYIEEDESMIPMNESNFINYEDKYEKIMQQEV
jgi:hypothetical protein